jgi:hypothetical protein
MSTFAFLIFLDDCVRKWLVAFYVLYLLRCMIPLPSWLSEEQGQNSCLHLPWRSYNPVEKYRPQSQQQDVCHNGAAIVEEQATHSRKDGKS